MPQKSATTTNTNSPPPLYNRTIQQPSPFNGGLFSCPYKAPSTECFFMPLQKPLSHTMQSTHPHHAEHPSTPCRTPFHTMQSTLPHHAEHASTPSKCPLTTYASRGKACLQIRDMGSLSVCKSPKHQKRCPDITSEHPLLSPTGHSSHSKFNSQLSIPPLPAGEGG